jgi:hypothetical protein
MPPVTNLEPTSASNIHPDPIGADTQAPITTSHGAAVLTVPQDSDPAPHQTPIEDAPTETGEPHTQIRRLTEKLRELEEALLREKAVSAGLRWELEERPRGH